MMEFISWTNNLIRLLFNYVPGKLEVEVYMLSENFLSICGYLSLGSFEKFVCSSCKLQTHSSSPASASQVLGLEDKSQNSQLLHICFLFVVVVFYFFVINYFSLL